MDPMGTSGVELDTGVSGRRSDVEFFPLQDPDAPIFLEEIVQILSVSYY
jgi:hypothetical protein